MIEVFAPYPEVLAAAGACLDRVDRYADLCVEVQQIPSPTGAEAVRASWIKTRLQQLRLAGVIQDPLYNVFARIPGRSESPALLVSAHSDTVFAATTDLTVRSDADQKRIYGPGIGDNSAGVASLLVLAELLSDLPTPPVDIWLLADRGEEGLGDLRGMRAAIERLESKLGACIVVEGMGLGRIVHRALGSRRFRITATAPGGHSWSDFGADSAIHVLVQLAADLARMRVPGSPRTTYNIGRIAGGRSINTIAQKAMLELDLRSEDQGMLEQLIQDVTAVVDRFRTPQWQRREVAIEVEQIGDRPSGAIAENHPLVLAAVRALLDANYHGAVDLRISSTDANIPLSQGIPAVCVGVTEGGNAHRLQEWISVPPLGPGMRHLLLLTWWAAMWLGGELA